MSILAKIFGGREEIASATIEKELAGAGRHLEGAKARLAKVTDRLTDPSMLSADDHRAADTDSRELTLAIVRYEKQIEKLTDAMAKAKASEALDDLQARAKAMRQRLDRDVPKALDDYDEHAAGVAEAIGRYELVRLAIEKINSELRDAGLEQIDSPEWRYRCAPAAITPARYETQKVWVRQTRGLDGHIREQTAMLFHVDENGERVPSEHGFSPVTRKVKVASEHRGQDDWLPALSGAQLPPSRIGSATHWPPPSH